MSDINNYVLDVEGVPEYSFDVDDNNLEMQIDDSIQVIVRLTYIHRQYQAAATWTIVHNLRRYPSVTVVDSGNTKVTGDVDYIDENTLVISFTAPFAGVAYLN